MNPMNDLTVALSGRLMRTGGPRRAVLRGPRSRCRRLAPGGCGVILAIIVCTHAWPTALSGAPQDPEALPGGARWELRLLDRESGVSLGGVLVSFPGLGESRVTDSRGVAPVPPGTGDSVRVVATRVGYAAVDTVVVPPAGGTGLDLPMVRSAIALGTLTVEAERAAANSRELARRMFEREVAVGAVGMTRAGVRAVPAVGEADVFRSLQSVSGVTSINDFGAEMFVRGGDADQVAVLVDGAPVFGPYHMFGMIGVFNPDAIESTELYKGSIPARYGGSLSGVVSARQGTGMAEGATFSGGLSALCLRTALNGALPWAHGWWRGGRPPWMWRGFRCHTPSTTSTWPFTCIPRRSTA